FLEKNATKVIPIGIGTEAQLSGVIYKDSIDFIKQIFDQCVEAQETTSNQVRYKEVVFISYCWTDKSLAERFRNELEKNGINVFFDDDALKHH
ncbi:MAG: TIR domain-containing protein, partial [Gammaproteobacteria bacterium]|nr:TIR domain-containing protein [Gammaproteobacteria bacterium]